mgnify:CR=1 FL=1
MAELPFMPLWTDAYLADTDHLSFEQHGIYLKLLMLIWRTPGCQVPNDQAWIERRMRLSSGQFENLLKPLLEEYLDNTGNYITSKRLQREFEYAQEKSQKQSARAKSRWLKEKGVSPGNANTMRVNETPPDLDDSQKKSASDKLLETKETGASPGNAPIPIPIVVKKEIPTVSPKKKKPVKNQGQRLPENWWPEDKELKFAVERIGEVKAYDEIEKFRDHWAAAPGAKGRKADWPATWRNWIRRQPEFNAKSNGGGSGPASITAAIRERHAGEPSRQRLQSDRLSADPGNSGGNDGGSGVSDQSQLIAAAPDRDFKATGEIIQYDAIKEFETG